MFLLVALLLPASGCRSRATCFRITAFGEHPAGEAFVENFPDGAFTQNALGNYQLAFELPPTRIPVRTPVPPSEDDADGNPDGDAPTAGPPPITANQPPPTAIVPDEVYISQIVFIELIWNPQPGTTFVESSQTNAGITYCLVRGGEVVHYEGAGFVSFKLDRARKTMTGRIESATLYPAKESSQAVDLLGPCRLTADFVAQASGWRVADVQRRLAAPARFLPTVAR